jgi:hypothetical protein
LDCFFAAFFLVAGFVPAIPVIATSMLRKALLSAADAEAKVPFFLAAIFFSLIEFDY